MDAELRNRLLALKTEDGKEYVITEFGGSPRFKALVGFIQQEVAKAEIAQVQRLRNALDYTLSKTIKRENLKRHLDDRIAELSQTLKEHN